MAEQAHKERVRDFYDVVSPYFRALWGEHLHDGLYENGDETKEVAQDRLVAYLARTAGIRPGAAGLDIGCGMGATSVWLARELGCRMTGVTLSPVQVEIARELATRAGVDATFLLGDAEALAVTREYDFLWMVGVLGHMTEQRNFIASAPGRLRRGGRFVLADWIATRGLTPRDRERYVEPVLEGMLMPDIAGLEDYRSWFEESGYRVLVARDIALLTRRTWDEGVRISQVPWLYRIARDVGRDALGVLKAIRAMRVAMGRGHIGYGVVVAQKR